MLHSTRAHRSPRALALHYLPEHINIRTAPRLRQAPLRAPAPNSASACVCPHPHPCCQSKTRITIGAGVCICTDTSDAHAARGTSNLRLFKVLAARTSKVDTGPA
ncbi:hypothetical protein B0H17DRAFT_1198507 [Mycena rosella]|uniref:Uncharacterized protein n=1 Tax=Mycena rosella TaxID=1033263 RepID=A0AAD7DN39_MYCRO|nr:hypothetical protein B0H17DRAFT_1198507 [Mycena rosella]